MSVTQCLFLKFSELQVRVDGVNAMPRRRDAVDVAVRESPRLVSFATLSFPAGQGRDDKTRAVGLEAAPVDD